MKVTLESTSDIVTLPIEGKEVPARVWEGVTEKGVKCHAFITLIACKNTEDNSEFERDLQEITVPAPEGKTVGSRLCL